MTRFGINTTYFMHSTPEYNRKHKEENSKYNHKYYEEHKEKWQDNDEEDEDDDKSSDSKKKSDDDESDSAKKKSGKSDKSKEDKVKELLKKLSGGSKKGGSPIGKKNSSKSSSSKKEKTEEQKKKSDEEEEEARRKSEEEKKKNSEAAEKYKQTLEANAKYIEEHQKGKKKSKPNVSKSNKSVKHSAVYIGINSQPYFEHHGILGMKWGKRNGPPYPLDYSKLSEEERAKDKERVRKEGDIDSVAYKKNRQYFSDQEIQDVINRYNLNSRINQLSMDNAKMKAGKSKTEQMADNLAKVADVGNKLANGIQAGTNVYNNVAKIMNAFGDSDLPIIGQSKPEKKNDWKVSKKELDKIIKDLPKNLDNYSNQDLEALNRRKTQLSLLTKENDEKAARDALAKQYQKEVDDRNRMREEERQRFEEGNYRQKFSNVYIPHVDGEVVSGGKTFAKDFFSGGVEHVSGDVVDSDGMAYVSALLEDKQRR